MQGWKEKLLSQAGKEIMIKAVIQSIPTYSMSVFRLPTSLCKDIEAMIRKFWWGQGENRKIYWVNWKTMCASKSVGGMRFRDIQMFNNAMLGKQVWHLFHHRDTLLYKVFSAKYFPHVNILDAPIHPKCSYAWRSILQAREVIHKGAVWRIGDGKGIDIWDQKWLPDLAYNKVVSPRIDSQINKVCDLFLPNSKVWNEDLINTMFYSWEASVINSTILSEGEENDTLVWPLTPDGLYSVRTAYRLQENGVSQENPSSSSTGIAATVWKRVWNIQAPSKIKHFVWRALRDSLPTKPNLRIQNIMVDETCSLCEDGTETVLHSLWYCEQAQMVWKSEKSFVDLYKKQHRSFMDLFELVNKEGSSFRMAWFATIA